MLTNSEFIKIYPLSNDHPLYADDVRCVYQYQNQTKRKSVDFILDAETLRADPQVLDGIITRCRENISAFPDLASPDFPRIKKIKQFESALVDVQLNPNDSFMPHRRRQMLETALQILEKDN